MASIWKKGHDTAEVIESPPRHWVAKDRQTWEFVVDDRGRAYFDTLEELEAALVADGWTKQ